MNRFSAIQYCLGVLLIASFTLADWVQAQSSGPTDRGQIRARVGGEGVQDEAQVATPILQGPKPIYSDYTTSLPSRREELEGIRMFDGKLNIHPFFDGQVSYTDNVRGTSENLEQDDILIQTLPGVEFNARPAEKIFLDASYQFGWHEYVENDGKDYLTHDASLSLRFEDAIWQNFDITLHEDYKQDGNVSVLEDDFFSFTRLQGNNAGITFNYQGERIGFMTDYTFGTVDYFSRRFESNDYYLHDVRSLFSYRWTKYIVSYVTYEYTRTIFDKVGGRDFDTHTIGAGVRWSLGKQFHFNFEAGNRRSILLRQYDSDDGWYGRFRLDYVHNKYIQAYFSAMHEFRVAPLTGGQDVSEFVLGGDFNPWRKLILTPQARWRREYRYNLRQDTTQLGLQASYQVHRHVNLFGGYNYSQRLSNRSRDVFINTGYMGLIFKW